MYASLTLLPMTSWRPVIALALLATACTGASAETTISPPSSSTTFAPITTTTAPITGCAGGTQFIEGGEVASAESSSSDASTIGLISWATVDDCETFEITFETSQGAPATTAPSIRASFIGDLGVLRVGTSAASTIISDQIIETGLVSRIYVVRSLNGGTFIDFHLTGPTQARTVVRSSPARLTLQLQPGLVALGRPPAAAGPVVLIEPVDDATVPIQTTVGGYANDIAEVLMIATSNDRVVAQQTVSPAAASDGWAEFRADLQLAAGEISLFAGDEDPDSGRFDGVSIDITVR